MGELGVNHYVVKPVKRHELFAAVSDAMAAVAPPARTAVEPREEKTLNGSAAPMLDRPLRILLADDSVDNRMLITAYLKKTRYVLDQVEDGQAALDRFMTRAYDVVLMDIQMPVLDGFGAVRKIRAVGDGESASADADHRADGVGARKRCAALARGRLRSARQQAGKEIDAAPCDFAGDREGRAQRKRTLRRRVRLRLVRVNRLVCPWGFARLRRSPGEGFWGNEFPTLRWSRRPDLFRHRGVRWRQCRWSLLRSVAGSARPAAEESRSSGRDVWGAGGILRPGPGFCYRCRVGTIRHGQQPTRLRKRRRWRASTNSARLSPNRCAPSSIRRSSNTRTA